MRETDDNAVGLVGGRYEIVRPLASGGMATVYIARHHLTRQEVALKVVASVFAQDPAGVARFLREVSVASRIQHDGVVRVFDAGFDETLRSPYLAMELLEGGSLAEMLSERKVDQEGALRMVLAFLDPLAAAHDAGVVHRDLKPENVFVTRDGRVKLLDFGVARDLRGSRATMEGTALGTVYYMAPEQAIDARSVGAAADVYAVGVTLYQILCGIFPFDGTTPHAVLIRANRETAVPTATRAPWVHANLCELVDRCLAKSPDERPADAAALRGLLAVLLDDAEVIRSVRGRAVNPATFLSTPPPPSLSGDFLDPFAAAATTPPPVPPAPRAVTEVAAPESAAAPRRRPPSPWSVRRAGGGWPRRFRPCFSSVRWLERCSAPRRPRRPSGHRRRRRLPRLRPRARLRREWTRRRPWCPPPPVAAVTETDRRPSRAEAPRAARVRPGAAPPRGGARLPSPRRSCPRRRPRRSPPRRPLPSWSPRAAARRRRAAAAPLPSWSPRRRRLPLHPRRRPQPAQPESPPFVTF